MLDLKETQTREDAMQAATDAGTTFDESAYVSYLDKYKNLVLSYMPVDPNTGETFDPDDYWDESTGKYNDEYEDAYKESLSNLSDADMRQLQLSYQRKRCGIGDFDNSSIAAAAVSLSYPNGFDNYDIDDAVTGDDDHAYMRKCTSLYVAIVNMLGLDSKEYSSEATATWAAVQVSGRDDNFPQTFEEQKTYLNYDTNITDTNHSPSASISTGYMTKWRYIGHLVDDDKTVGHTMLDDGSSSGCSNPVKIVNLQPGDILINSEHIYIYVGWQALSKFGDYAGFADCSYAICYASDGEAGMMCQSAATLNNETVTSDNNIIKTLIEEAGTDMYIVYRAKSLDYELSENYQKFKKVDVTEYYDGSTETSIRYRSGTAPSLYTLGIEDDGSDDDTDSSTSSSGT
jgi:hypothetical protein